VAPKGRWWGSQRWKRGEALAQQAAARMMKGVVGIIGRKMPMMPKRKETAPQKMSK